MALPAELLYLRDWWEPKTLTGAPIGIETFLFGFFAGGTLATSIRPYLQKNTLYQNIAKINVTRIAIVIAIGFGAMTSCMFYFNINSFLSTIIAAAIVSTILLIKRTDLILWYFIGAFYALFLAIIIYSILDYIFPGWVLEFYHFKNVPKVTYFGISLDDIVWYFTVGGMFSIAYHSLCVPKKAIHENTV